MKRHKLLSFLIPEQKSVGWIPNWSNLVQAQEKAKESIILSILAAFAMDSWLTLILTTTTLALLYCISKSVFFYSLNIDEWFCVLLFVLQSKHAQKD